MKAVISVAALTFWLMGCTSDASFRRGQELLAAGQSAEGLQSLHRAMEEAPGNHVFRNAYFRQRELHLAQALAQADTQRNTGDLTMAEASYRRALTIDPNSDRAQSGLAGIAMEQRHRERLKDAETLLKAGKVDATDIIVRSVLAENPAQREARALRRRLSGMAVGNEDMTPILRAGLSKPTSLDLKDAPLRSVFDLFTRASGVNFVLDKEIRTDARATLNVKNSPVEDVIRLVLTTNQLDYKVLNDNTLLIFPNTQAKAKDYKDLLVKGFYLANVEAKQMANTIKTLVKTKDIVVDEKLNYIAMRDTPEAIRVAERLIAQQDMPEPEVLLELEVLEVSANRLLDLGIRYPEQFSYGITGAANTPGTVTLPEWQNRSSSLVRMTVTNPSLIVNLKKVDSDTNLLANPRIRVKNREKAKVHIGERVPVITTTSTANVGVSEAVSYLDVGLKLEVEPTIALTDDVSIKVGLEVSNILETVTRASGLQTYRLGTRNASTSLRLRDSETQVLAGLIQDDDRKTANKLPGLGDIPFLGRLFSSRSDSNVKTEVVLLITPRIVRNLSPDDGGGTSFFSGTEAMISTSPLRLRGNDLAKPESSAQSLSREATGIDSPAVATQPALVSDGDSQNLQDASMLPAIAPAATATPGSTTAAPAPSPGTLPALAPTPASAALPLPSAFGGQPSADSLKPTPARGSPKTKPVQKAATTTAVQ